ncbi:MAG: hypothetical protein AB8C13_03245 [Phycisphaerales bacterium]
MRITTSAIVAGLAVSAMSSAALAVDYDEAVSGDLSNDRFAPTFIGFDEGLNTVTMDIIDSNASTGDLDYFTFDIGAGQFIDSISIIDASNPLGGQDSVAFVGLAFDSIFDFDSIDFSGDGLEGFVLTSPDLFGVNSLGELSGTNASTLGPGSYSFWVQQTNTDLTRVTLGVNVVPAPGSLAILGVAAAGLRRRR